MSVFRERMTAADRLARRAAFRANWRNIAPPIVTEKGEIVGHGTLAFGANKAKRGTRAKQRAIRAAEVLAGASLRMRASAVMCARRYLERARRAA